MTRNQSPESARLWTRVSRAFIVSVLVLITFIAFESFAITTVLPVAMAELGARWYSLAYAASIVAAMVGMVIGGNWADRSGPRAPLTVGGALFLVGLALSALAPDVTTFILARIIKGIGGGIDSVIMYVLIARRISEPQRPRMFGLLSAAWILPSLAGPVVAGALTEFTSWRTVFLLVLAGSAVALVSLLLSTRSLAPHERTEKRIVGRTGALSVVAAL
uniref:MFS transporter n=1 Tax=uncultured Agrococcus sp. TaxID=382258 RepID=UPI0025CDF874